MLPEPCDKGTGNAVCILYYSIVLHNSMIAFYIHEFWNRRYNIMNTTPGTLLKQAAHTA
jgi:hypothetical protein